MSKRNTNFLFGLATRFRSNETLNLECKSNTRKLNRFNVIKIKFIRTSIEAWASTST